jgi:hypothetical protein
MTFLITCNEILVTFFPGDGLMDCLETFRDYSVCKYAQVFFYFLKFHFRSSNMVEKLFSLSSIFLGNNNRYVYQTFKGDILSLFIGVQ